MRSPAENDERPGGAVPITSGGFDIEQFRMGMDVALEHGTQDLATNVTDDDIDSKRARRNRRAQRPQSRRRSALHL